MKTKGFSEEHTWSRGLAGWLYRHLSHEFLRGVARTFHVPIALLSIDLPQHHSFTAFVGIGEPAAEHESQPWGTMFRQVLNSRQPLVIPDTRAALWHVFRRRAGLACAGRRDHHVNSYWQ